MIVGKRQNTIGIIRSFYSGCEHLPEETDIRMGTFLSEYHPHNRVVIEATAPPGVERMSVCLVLHQH